MSNLNSQLLNILPASERVGAYQQNQAGASRPALQRQVSVERTSGLDALKTVLRSSKVSAFKYAKNNDSLYVYYKTDAGARIALDAFIETPQSIGGLTVTQSGPSSIRIDRASTFSSVVGVATGTLDFDAYVREAKSHFTATHDAANVSVVFRVDNSEKTITATATSSRLRTAEFELSRRLLSTRIKGIEKNVAAGYQATAVFGYKTYLAEIAPKVVEVSTGSNALLEGLKVSMAPADVLTAFAGKFSDEVIEQFVRIVAGERLPAPQVAIYDDEAAVGKTQGTAIAMFYANGNRVDIEAILLGLAASNKSAAVFPTEVVRVVLHDTVVEQPSVIIMRDHGNANKAYLVLNTTKGFHRHIILNKRK